MSKIIVRKQEYANNGTHADEIKAVVRDDLVVNTLSSATDLVPSVGLLNTVNTAMTNLTDRISVSAAMGGSWSGTLPDTRHRILVTGQTGQSSLCGIYLLYQSNAVMPIVPAPSLSVTIPGSRLLTITNNSSGTTGGTMNGVII